MNENIKMLKEELEKYNISIDTNMEDKFNIYLEMLIEWNKKMNLTAITNPREIAIKHFLDSAILIDALKFNKNDKVIDIGTGAGFPGIPLKIIMDYINLTLLDSLKKRLVFIEELKKNIGIEARVLHIRAEEGSRKEEYRERFDKVVSRAVSYLNVLSEYCLPYVKVGGKFIAMKGPNAINEIEDAKKSIEILGGKIIDVKEYDLLGENKRNIVIIEKIAQTPMNYPRHGSKISKKPL